jgi:hypothetical protein
MAAEAAEGAVAAVVVAAAGVADGKAGIRTMRTLRAIVSVVSLSLAGPALAAAAAPTRYPSAQAAADALVAAAAAQDVAALEAMLAPDGKALVVSGDDVQDHNDRARFAEAAKEKLSVVVDPKDPHRATLAVGEDGWTFPAPLVEKDGQWQFDGKAGLREVVDRRVGSNELDAIQICHGYVDAQLEYAAEDRNGDGVKEYAQRVISTEGKRDGLVWKAADGSLEGPVSEPIARAISQGYKDRTKPYHGYYFRVLKRQGKNAHLGAMDYVVQGRMIGGFALVAWPASYRVSGVQTFIVNHEGVVYEKDLGPDTAKIASGMTAFDPGKGWKPVP